jgi:Lrp/AsnC family transcriptional regulator for asnA, asnC and gidA
MPTPALPRSRRRAPGRARTPAAPGPATPVLADLDDLDLPDSAPTALDGANRAIIEALQRDGRRPYGAIAEEVGLSEAAVRRRVQRLREHGVIQIVAVTDPMQMGFARQAMVGIKVEGDVRLVASKVAGLDVVDYVVMCAGSFDLLAELFCEDDEQLLTILNDSIRSIPGVRATETFMYLKLEKQTYTWGTR